MNPDDSPVINIQDSLLIDNKKKISLGHETLDTSAPLLTIDVEQQKLNCSEAPFVKNADDKPLELKQLLTLDKYYKTTEGSFLVNSIVTSLSGTFPNNTLLIYDTDKHIYVYYKGSFSIYLEAKRDTKIHLNSDGLTYRFNGIDWVEEVGGGGGVSISIITLINPTTVLEGDPIPYDLVVTNPDITYKKGTITVNERGFYTITVISYIREINTEINLQMTSSASGKGFIQLGKFTTNSFGGAESFTAISELEINETLQVISESTSSTNSLDFLKGCTVQLDRLNISNPYKPFGWSDTPEPSIGPWDFAYYV